MTALHLNPDLQRRKQVRLRLRPNLVFSQQQGSGRISYVVKDPVNLRYFHLEENQRFLVELMDGQHTLADIQRIYEAKFRPERLTLEELEAFAAHLLECGLVQNEAPHAGQRLYERALDQERRSLLARLLNVLGLRVPL